jgi:hypothetical protein
LNGWSVSEDTCDTAVLVVSELVTNAIVHTASSIVVCELHDGDDLVRIAVGDEGCAPGEPQPSPQRAEEEHGRGLLLVDALCHAWGAHEHGPGLLVWAELPRTADTSCLDTGARGDLGWGARPKPGPSGGSGDEDEAEDHVGPGAQAQAHPEPCAEPEGLHGRSAGADEWLGGPLPEPEAHHHRARALGLPRVEWSRDRGTA